MPQKKFLFMLVFLTTFCLIFSCDNTTDRGCGSDDDTGEAMCGPNDSPETGVQGGQYSGTVNCGLSLLSSVPEAGSVQGSGHCAYVRLPGRQGYTGSVIKAFSLADPLNPVQTDEVEAIGGSESMRAMTVEGRAILVSGRGVYDISNCEKMVKKGEIPWPSQAAQNDNYMMATTSHEIAISHDAKRVYSGLGFGIAYIEDLERPETWVVKDWKCEMSRQSGFTPEAADPELCQGPTHPDVPGRQYSHDSDDNLEGTMWYGANQEGSNTQNEPPTARMVDISDPNSITILDTLPNFPGHSMSFWRDSEGRDFIMGANEGLGNRCQEYPRPTKNGNARDAYIVEVTGNKFGEPFPLTLDINTPEFCREPGRRAAITATSMYNKDGAAFVMMEFGGAGLRVFDLRDGYNPKEVAYYNDGNGHTHSGQFHYEESRGILVTSGAKALNVLVMQPQTIEALGLPYPTDPAYPYK